MDTYCLIDVQTGNELKISSDPELLEIVFRMLVSGQAKFLFERDKDNGQCVYIDFLYIKRFSEKHKMYEYIDKVTLSFKERLEIGQIEDVEIDINFRTPENYQEQATVWELPAIRVLELEIMSPEFVSSHDRASLLYGPAPKVNCEIYCGCHTSSYTDEDFESDMMDAQRDSYDDHSSFFDATDGQVGDLGDDFGWTYLRG